MFNDKLAEAIGEARTLARLDQLSEAVWKAWGAGGVSDEDANAAAALLSARRAVVRGDIKPVGIPPGRNTLFPPRRVQCPPDRPSAIARRRQLAASGPMPPALAARFTTAELAALRIVSDEVHKNGSCARTIAEIAARAGCSRTTVKNAIREAAKLGLVTIQERRRQGNVNLPNVIRIVSREWTTWLARRSKGVGVRNPAPTDIRIEKGVFERQSASPAPGSGASGGKLGRLVDVSLTASGRLGG